MIPEDAIRANAQLVVARFRSPDEFGADFGYNRESVKWIEGFIERERQRLDVKPKEFQRLSQVLGSYLGECIIHVYGGEWRQRDGSWGVFFDRSNGVFPFQKVWKQFQHGVEAGDSILGMFDLIGPVFIDRSQTQ